MHEGDDGFSRFLREARKDPSLGKVISSFLLVCLFVGLTILFSLFSGGFMIALAVLMLLASIAALGIFFFTFAIMLDNIKG